VARTARKKPTKKSRRNVKPVSVMALCVTAGFFLGFGLGALMDNLLLIIALGLIAGAATGYYFDKKNNIPYTRRNH
jgi:uncharacterized membrane protein YfcA